MLARTETLEVSTYTQEEVNYLLQGLGMLIRDKVYHHRPEKLQIILKLAHRLKNTKPKPN